MGHRFYEHTLPELVQQLERVGDLLGMLVDQAEASAEASEEATDEREVE